MSKLIDLTNQDFGFWHVIERAENRSGGRSYWKCECTACGKIKEVAGSHLRGGRSTNCGCIRMEKMRQASIKREEGKIYGFLKVERMATEDEKPRVDRTGIYWNCTCQKCGKENVIIFGDYLRNGDTISCGCVNSKNESRISQILNSIHFSFKTQYTFEDLTSTGRACDRLLFDFAIFNQNNLLYIIEYDGIQHFKAVLNSAWNTPEKLKITRKNDLLKNKYCFEHNIPLIRIPYDEDYTIDDLRLETTRFLLTPENEQEYYDSRKENI